MGTPVILSQVPNSTPYIQYVATSNQTVFPYPFPITQDSDLVVVANGSTLATDSGYSVSGVGVTGGGNITFSVGRTAGDIITLYRAIAIQRITQINQNSGYASSTLNAEFNNVYLLLQQLQVSLSLCLQLPNTNSPTPTTLLTPGAYANKYLSFDANGNPAPAALTNLGTLTQAIITGLLYPQTTAEAGASVTPSNLLYWGGPGYTNVQRYAGADPTFQANSTSAFDSACRGLGAAGGKVFFAGSYLIDTALNVPDNVTLQGYETDPGQNHSQNGDYTPTRFASTLVINPSVSIKLNSRTAVQNAVVINKNFTSLGTYPTPFANATVATNAVAAFAGHPFTSALSVYDMRLEDLLVLGFADIYDGVALNVSTMNRPSFYRVRGDCTNGIKVQNVFDMGKARDCEMWPFLTTNQSYTTDALITRTGTGFYTGGGSTWMQWFDCFTFGYQNGHWVSGVQDVRLESCGADGPATSQPGSGCVGFYFDGSCGNVVLMQPQATAQANAGIYVNTSAQNNQHAIQIIAPVCHGNNSANGYINIQQGDYLITDGIFYDNSTVGHIQLGASAGKGSIKGAVFGNGGSNPPVFGDASALLRCQLSGEVYRNTTGTAACGGGNSTVTFTPTVTFGGAAVGVTYGTQNGKYERFGRLVRVSVFITLTSKGSSTGNAKIEGLPGTISQLPIGADGLYPLYSVNMGSLTGPLMAQPGATTSKANLYHSGATGIVAVTDANFTNTSSFQGTFTYELDI